METLGISEAKSKWLVDTFSAVTLVNVERSGRLWILLVDRSALVRFWMSAKAEGTTPMRLLLGRVTWETRLPVMVTPNQLPVPRGVVVQLLLLVHPGPVVELY